MKMKNLFGMLLVFAAVASASCSKDDDQSSDPLGTVTLNMLDEANGKTLLDNSGIYIDKGQNFVAGENCEIFVIGKSGGLGSVAVKELKTSASKAAVQSGYGYVAARPGALIVFPSGAKALPIWSNEVNYMKFYVTSPLKDGDKTVGAAVKYVLAKPNNYGLPEHNSIALSIYPYETNEATLTLSDPDFEYDFHGDDYVSCVKQGRKLVFKVEGVVSYEYTLYLRIRESYTRVYVKVTM